MTLGLESLQHSTCLSCYKKQCIYSSSTSSKIWYLLLSQSLVKNITTIKHSKTVMTSLKNKKCDLANFWWCHDFFLFFFYVFLQNIITIKLLTKFHLFWTKKFYDIDILICVTSQLYNSKKTVSVQKLKAKHYFQKTFS